MYSADHFKKEVPMNVTSLAELLHEMQDHVFTVGFRRQPTEERACELLQNAAKGSFQDPKALSQLSKQLVSGSECKMTCHMVEVENNLGRSLVIDLNTKG